ncbi:hypothetical protein FPSE5266_20121 [Fusarium pseudograminearum]|nr:hypothetical protein FPSE5266_20121 [Fusarium pseudograminearum]
MSTVAKDLSQQDASSVSGTQVPPNPHGMTPSSVDCLVQGMVPTSTATSQLDTLAMASMLLSQRATPVISPPSLMPDLADTMVVQPATERRSSSYTQHSSDVETRHHLDSHPHMAGDRLRSRNPGRLRQQDRLHRETTTMDVDSSISNMQRLSGLDSGFSHPDAEATADILDFLHHGTDTDMLNMMVDFSLPFALSSTTGNLASSSEDRMRSVPDERFDLVSRLWPREWDLGTGGFATTDIRRDMISTIQNSPDSDHAMSNPFSNISTSTQNTEWAIDNLRQQDLWQEFDPDTFDAQQEQQQDQQNDFSGARHRESSAMAGSSDGGDGPAFDAIFPSTRILNLGIAVALRQPHFLVSFVHRSTFAARKASNFSATLLLGAMSLCPNMLLVNTDVFEIAAGRTNVEEAHSALKLIASWSKTKAARRACLHAAGIYKAMGRRRINDDMMLHSEASMFLAALVLGLYIFMVPQGGDVDDINTRETTTEPLEILDNVDWTRLGLVGFGSNTSDEAGETQNEAVESAASCFISQGMPFSFMGTVCEGGYDGARMVLLEFAHLMGDLSKGNPDGLRQVLKAMTDSLIDLEIDT